MKKKRLFFVVLGVAVVLIITGIFLSLRGYPVARVNGEFISGKDLSKVRAMTIASSEKILKVSGTSTFPIDPESREAEAIILDQLIEQSLVHGAWVSAAGRGGNTLLKTKLSIVKDSERAQGADFFKTSPKEYQKYVLLPTAEKDLFSGRLFLLGKTYEEWLAEARKTAEVKIFSDTVRWDGMRVVIAE